MDRRHSAAETLASPKRPPRYLNVRKFLQFTVLPYCWPVLPCASFNFPAHSSQQTSTTFPPNFTLIAPSSSLQSHAAHVFSIPISSTPERRIA